MRGGCETYRAAPDRLENVGIHTACVDETAGIPALERIAPTKPTRPEQIEKREFEYKPHGSQCLTVTGEVIAPTVAREEVRQRVEG